MIAIPAMVMGDLADRIDDWLPQTQCRQCGFPDCRAYAEAVVAGAAGINRCPPGGEATIAALAALTGRPLRAPDPDRGPRRPRAVAVIAEPLCIGCVKCLEACPVDAIVGARRLMHTVIASECTGCGLCLPPCPMDCIALEPAPRVGDPWPEYDRAEAARTRMRYRAHLARAARRREAGARADDAGRVRRKAEIRAAVERVRARRRALPAPGLKR